MLKIYGALWIVIAIMAALLFVTGNFSMVTLLVFGVVCFGMIYMGMISVLPSTIVHHVPAVPKVKPAKPAKVSEERVFHTKHLATR
jgi:hypothetical protein